MLNTIIFYIAGFKLGMISADFAAADGLGYAWLLWPAVLLGLGLGLGLGLRLAAVARGAVGVRVRVRVRATLGCCGPRCSS